MFNECFKAAKALTLGFVFCACASAANITYYGTTTSTLNNVDYPVAYSITTNGNIGTLAASDLVGMTLGPNFNDQTAMGSNTHVLNSALTATAEGIFANFSVQDWLLQFDNFGSSYNMVMGPNGLIGPTINNQYVGSVAALSGSQDTVQIASVNGIEVGAAAPEPSTTALMLAPLALALLARKRLHV